MNTIQTFQSIFVLLIIFCVSNLEAGEDQQSFFGKVLLKKFHLQDEYSIRDLFVEDVPGTKSYWLGPLVEVVEIKGVDRFFIVKGYNRFYFNAAVPQEVKWWHGASPKIYDFYGPFEGKPSDHFNIPTRLTKEKALPN